MLASTSESSTETAGKRFALVVGVNQTQSTLLPPLQHAIADAEAIAEVLQHTCDFELSLPPLLGEQASSAAVKKAVLNLARNRSDDDLLLLYFSGHGQQAYDPQRSEQRHAYLGTADFNEEDVTDDPTLHVTMHWLRDKLFRNTTAGQVLIVLDCCYAEDIRTVSDHTLDELREQIAYYLLEIPGAEVNLRRSGLRVALAACGYDQVAGEQDGNGLLTRQLL
jgi:uncharacterized caspase-like protein